MSDKKKKKILSWFVIYQMFKICLMFRYLSILNYKMITEESMFYKLLFNAWFWRDKTLGNGRFYRTISQFNLEIPKYQYIDNIINKFLKGE